MVFDILDAPRIHQGSYISIFRTLPSRKVVQLLGSLLGYIKEATYQFSHLNPPGKWSNSWVLQSVIQESKRTLEVPERNLGSV